MQNNNLLKNFEKFGDLFTILGISPTANKKEIKRAYKDKALIYHPDKNKAADAVEKFQHIKDAYEILSDDILKESYEKFLKNKQYHQNRKFEQNSERSKYAQDLLQKEEEYNKKKEDEAQDKLRKFFARKEDLEKKQAFKKKKEEEKEELELLTKNVNYVDESEFSKKVNSIKVKWNKKINVSYDEEIIKLIFQEYGSIKDCFIIAEKKTAIIEFFTLASAEKAYEEYNKKNENGETLENDLKVKFLMKRKKRAELIESFQKRKNNKIDLTVNSNTLERIGAILNRDSGIYLGTQMQELRKQEERRKMINEIIEKEMKK